MIRVSQLLLAVFLTACAALNQAPGTRMPSVEFAPVGKVEIKAGSVQSVPLDFRVANDFHINSNKPRSELLIPTVLQLSTPDAVNVISVHYPPGQDSSFPFAPDEKLSVYSGDFAIAVAIKASAKALPGTYPVSGELRYQACDRSACYPPRTMPVKFEVSVIR